MSHHLITAKKHVIDRIYQDNDFFLYRFFFRNQGLILVSKYKIPNSDFNNFMVNENENHGTFTWKGQVLGAPE